MNIKQIKDTFTLESLLSRLGHMPDQKKSRGNDLWYVSPFRPEEKTPSFHIKKTDDIFKDFGEAEKGGDLIRFAQLYLKSRGKDHSISATLQWFRDLNGGHFSPSPIKPKPISKPQDYYSIISDKPVFSAPLFEYLDMRKITRSIAKRYLRQIYFMENNTQRKMYGLGFKVRSGGYDIRNPLGFKTMIGSKDITFIKGESDSRTVHVFEGVMDFLTKLSIERKDTPKEDTIILNSTSLYEQAANTVKAGQYTYAALWQDNDRAGKKFKDAFFKEFKDDKKHTLKGISSMNHIYKDYDDLNHWHMNAYQTQGTLPLLSKRFFFSFQQQAAKINLIK